MPPPPATRTKPRRCARSSERREKSRSRAPGILPGWTASPSPSPTRSGTMTPPAPPKPPRTRRDENRRGNGADRETGRKLRARDSNRRVDSSSEDAEATRRREATIAARSARRRENSRNFDARFAATTRTRWAAPPLETPSAPSRGRFLRLTPEEDALAERLLAEFDAAGDSDLDVEFDAAGDSDLDDIVASASARTRVRNPFEPSTSDARDRPGSRDAGANENATSSATSSDASFGGASRGDRRGTPRVRRRARGRYFRSASRASSRPASAAASDVSLSVSVSVSVSASEDASNVFLDERLRAADEEVDRRLRLLKTTDPLPERLDADEMATLMRECRQSSAADPETRGGDR